jgi:hypothetical protein
MPVAAFRGAFNLRSSSVLSRQYQLFGHISAASVLVCLDGMTGETATDF